MVKGSPRLVLLSLTVLLAMPFSMLPEARATCEIAQRVLSVELDGRTEYFTVFEYSGDLYRLWYDDVSFVAVPLENGVSFELGDHELSGKVSFRIEDTWQPDRADEPSLADYREEYERQGWITEGLDAKGMLPRFGYEGDPAQAFMARKDGQAAEVYLAWAASGTYLCTLLYPQDTAEPWGARMRQMLNTLESLPGE